MTVRKWQFSVPCLFFALTIGGVAESQGLPTGRPEKMGFAPAGLSRIDSAIQAYVTEGKLRGRDRHRAGGKNRGPVLVAG